MLDEIDQGTRPSLAQDRSHLCQKADAEHNAFPGMFFFELISISISPSFQTKRFFCPSSRAV
jgi:hypothetical protein